MSQSIQIATFSRFIQVSRETITSLVKYENYLIKSNKTLNLIGKSTINEIWLRHFLDSSQVIDFIDKNTGSLIDLGSGAGFPGLIIAILAKDRKINLKKLKEILEIFNGCRIRKKNNNINHFVFNCNFLYFDT